MSDPLTGSASADPHDRVITAHQHRTGLAQSTTADRGNAVGLCQAQRSLAQEARFARHLLRQRRRRETILGKELFADPAWDMLLDLFASEIEGRRVAKSSLVIAAAVPQSTALRWISDLVNAGQLIRYPDPADGRRTFVTLTEESFRNVTQVLRAWIDDGKDFDHS